MGTKGAVIFCGWNCPLCLFILSLHPFPSASPNSMTVMWNTANDTKDSTVMYGQDGNTDKKTTGSAIKFTSSGTEKRFQYIHTVIISDLQPGTTYG